MTNQEPPRLKHVMNRKRWTTSVPVYSGANIIMWPERELTKKEAPPLKVPFKLVCPQKNKGLLEKMAMVKQDKVHTI